MPHPQPVPVRVELLRSGVARTCRRRKFFCVKGVEEGPGLVVSRGRGYTCRQAARGQQSAALTHMYLRRRANSVGSVITDE